MSSEDSSPPAARRAVQRLSPEAAAASAIPATITDYLRTARKHVLLVLACWAAIVAATLFWTIGQEKTYRAESMIRLDADPPKPLGTRVETVSMSNGNYWNRKEFYESEFRIIRSMRVAVATVRALGLNADPNFLHVKAADRPRFKPVSVEDAARILIVRLSVEPLKESSLAMVHYEDTDPKRSQLILNTLIRIYLAQNLEGTATVSSSALEWLNGQLEHLKADLESSEIALNSFREKNNILSVSLEDRHNMLTSQLEQFGKEITALEVRRTALASRNAELAKLKGTDPLEAGATDLLQSLVLSTLRTSYAEQSRNLQELSASLGEQHPKVLAARAKLDSTAKSIAVEVANIRSALARELRSVERQIGDLRKNEQEVQKQAHELQAFAVPYNQLSRAKTNNEKLYGLVLERARETDLTRVMNFNNIRVIDEATEPQRPVRPNVFLNLAMGATIGLLVGLGAALLRELSDRSIKTPAEVEALVGLPCLGLVPSIEQSEKQSRRRRSRARQVDMSFLSDRDLIVAAQPDSGVAEAMRAIRTNLTFMSPDHPYKAVVVTSAVPEEGKTTVACSLATVLAQSGFRVLLVDTDLRRPRLHRTFSVPNDLGVSMVVSGQISLDDCLQETKIPNLTVLTSGPIPPNPAEMLHSDRFKALTEQLRGKFDRVIFDSPPILPVTDAAILSQNVDGVVVVARGFRTVKSAVLQAARQLLDVNAHVIGIVLNAIDFGRQEYNGYHYYYRREGYYSLDAGERAHREVKTLDESGPPAQQ